MDTAGKLGVFLSARRFKTDIADMDKASEAILALKPVTFHYKKELIRRHPAVRPRRRGGGKGESRPGDSRRGGELYTVRYEAVNAMLLNEFLKEHRKNEEQEETIAELKIWNDCSRSNGERAGSANPEGERTA